ncbi:retrovirus-related Pol polyprotein from transposon TNT 1-94 [Trichonephila clavipes]|nr:retrovirus-related Pol polyprotein from transposon TNT 1-94 [Trichonephila clavipes]
MRYNIDLDNVNNFTCETCDIIKVTKNTHHSIDISQSSQILELLHADLCGPINIESYGGVKYFMVIVDDFSGMYFTYLLKNKYEVFDIFSQFKANYENLADKRIKKIRTDNGESNGKAERANRVLLERARSLLYESEIENETWDIDSFFDVSPERNEINQNTENGVLYNFDIDNGPVAIGNDNSIPPSDHVIASDKQNATPDSQAAIQCITATRSSNKSRHLNLRFHFIKDLIEDTGIKLECIQTEFLIAYFLAKVMKVENDEGHFWLNGYVNKQNCRIWSEANPQVYVETPLHPEKLTVWCALWAGGILLQKQ